MTASHCHFGTPPCRQKHRHRQTGKQSKGKRDRHTPVPPQTILILRQVTEISAMLARPAPSPKA